MAFLRLKRDNLSTDNNKRSKDFYFNEDRAILTDPDPDDVFLAEVSDVEYDEEDEDFRCAEDPDL